MYLSSRSIITSSYFVDSIIPPNIIASIVIEIENIIYEMWTQEERDSYIGLTQRYLEAFEKGVENLK